MKIDGIPIYQSKSADGVSGQLAKDEADAAFDFAARAYDAINKGKK